MVVDLSFVLTVKMEENVMDTSSQSRAVDVSDQVGGNTQVYWKRLVSISHELSFSMSYVMGLVTKPFALSSRIISS